MKKIIRANSKHITTMATRAQLEEYLDTFDKGIALCGRSNVGKSTFINAFFKNKIARVSNTPGKTSDVQVFSFDVEDENGEVHTFKAFDLPGFGHARVSKAERSRWDVLIDDFFKLYHKKCLFIHLMDSQHPFQKNDENFIEYFKRFKSKYWMIFNKIDKLKTQSARAKLKNLLKSQLNNTYSISAHKKLNLESIEADLVDYLLEN